ncbi:DUF1800 domain-containing protein [Micromonospora sp. NPDC049102]|uniref:DUF1800 domain-containing protein n=1 Tax=Micromonospora sp. NPDC049102 TaxID=3364265 RepID=UPI003717DEA2
MTPQHRPEHRSATPRLGRRSFASLVGFASVAAGGAVVASNSDRLPFFGADGPPPSDVGPRTEAVSLNTSANTSVEQSYMDAKSATELRKAAEASASDVILSRPSAAAAQAKASVPEGFPNDPILHLANRATFGATPALLARIKSMGIDAWIDQQLKPDSIPYTTAEVKIKELPGIHLTLAQASATIHTNKVMDSLADEYLWATTARMIWSDRQLFERVVDFCTDRINVPMHFDFGSVSAPYFGRDVIRKHAFGKYADMLVAAVQHAGLVIYLNQSQSQKARPNENLARELLELHTVGAGGGYTEEDVRQAALLQTGLGVIGGKVVTDAGHYTFAFRPNNHYTGPIKIMGFSHPNASADKGLEVIKAYVNHVVRLPAAAKSFARELATKFVSDKPSDALVDKLAKVYLDNDTAIVPVVRAMFSSVEFWASPFAKMHRPSEYLVSIYRKLGVQPQTAPGYKPPSAPARTPFADGLRGMGTVLNNMGQVPVHRGTADGWSDVATAYLGISWMSTAWTEIDFVLRGGRPALRFPSAANLLPSPQPATAGACVDALAQRLVAQKPTSAQRALLLSIAEVGADSPASATAFQGALVDIAKALLASPQSLLR